MKLNTDDTWEEQFCASMNRDTDVMINYECCDRLFYIDYDIIVNQ